MRAFFVNGLFVQYDDTLRHSPIRKTMRNQEQRFVWVVGSVESFTFPRRNSAAFDYRSCATRLCMFLPICKSLVLFDSALHSIGKRSALFKSQVPAPTRLRCVRAQRIPKMASGSKSAGAQWRARGLWYLIVSGHPRQERPSWTFGLTDNGFYVRSEIEYATMKIVSVFVGICMILGVTCLTSSTNVIIMLNSGSPTGSGVENLG
jgi:hypothetical protein